MRTSASRNRADAVRHRRKEEATRRLQDSAVIARYPVTPITTRTGSMPVSPARRRPAVRRRTEAALTMAGVEVHMPTINFTAPAAKWRFVSFGLSLLLGAAIYAAWTVPMFVTAPPQVSGNERIPAAEIEAVLGSTNTPVFTLVPRELERRLRLNFPEMLEAHVSVWLPNAVVVSVRERRPIIVWNQGGGYTWIDETGVAFRPRGGSEGLISVQAETSPTQSSAVAADPLTPLPFIPTDLVSEVQALAPHVPAGASIMYDERHGLGWTDNRGWQVFFGAQGRDVPLKLRVYDSLVQAVTSKGIRPDFISVEYADAPYYRLTQ